MSPYLTIAEAAELACVSPKRLRNLMADGTLRRGLHYSRPRGLRPRFMRAALVAWIEERESEGSASGQPTPPPRRRCKVDLSLIRGLQPSTHGL